MIKSQCVADFEGPWAEPDFRSGLIERCKRYWNVAVAELPNEMLATYLRQRIGLRIVIPEARKRLQGGIEDDSELYPGQLAKALAETSDV